MIGEDLQRLGALGDDTLADVADALVDLLGGHDPQLTSRKLLDQHRGPRSIALGLELPRNRDHVAVADAADLHDLHALSIYADSRLRKDTPH